MRVPKRVQGDGIWLDNGVIVMNERRLRVTKQSPMAPRGLPPRGLVAVLRRQRRTPHNDVFKCVCPARGYRWR
jgi:hypothetical protein